MALADTDQVMGMATEPSGHAQEVNSDDLDRWIREYLKHAPLSLTLREINRLIAIEALGSRGGPVLDVGCGDGFWWTLRDADHRQVYGVDISAVEIAQAKTRIQADLTDVSREQPFPEVSFREIIGNCSLEHVPDIDAALINLRRAAAPNARLLMFVPTPRWAFQGHVQSWLLNHAPRLAMTIAGALNGFFQHWHLYDAKVWTGLLTHNGWRVRAIHGLGSARSEFLFRAFMPPAFAEFLAKTGDRILSIPVGALSSGRDAGARGQAGALGAIGSTGSGRFADRVRVPDHRRGNRPSIAERPTKG